MKNILIVDDEKLVRELLSSFLRMRLQNDAVTVLTAEDGEAAIRTLKSTPVSLVITDLVMPKATGYNVAAYVRENCPAVPVFIMTGNASSPDLKMLQDARGIVRCIEKPFKLEEVELLVAESLGTLGQAPSQGATAPAPRVFSEPIEKNRLGSVP